MPNAIVTTLEKCQTGIAGFDEVSIGGLPRGRSTLLAGDPGAGKTLFAMEFVLRGIEIFHEPGIFVSFEETPEELLVNSASLGHDLLRFQTENKLSVIHMKVDLNQQVESGEYDLEGIFVRLGSAIDRIGARRIVLDAVENLFSAFTNMQILRSEFRRLIGFLKEKNVTAIITTERGVHSITRHGLEEYIVDCVVTLDNRVEEQIATRWLRIVKYRGSAHGADEYPFVLGHHGFSVIPITSAGLAYRVSRELVSTGIESLDEMLSGGIFRGSSILISGSAGTGKSSLATQMVDATCRRGEPCLYVALEESPDQIERNMESIGLNLAQWRQSGLLLFHAVRPTSSGLEGHLTNLTRLVEDFRPKMVIIDPITAFDTNANLERIKIMLIRVVDLLKSRGITSLFTSLSYGGDAPETTSQAISSLIDVWILLRNLESAGERTRGLYICKARGVAHSNQVREFILTTSGIRLEHVLLDPDGHVLTGSARFLRERLLKNENTTRNAEIKRRKATLEDRRRVLEAKIAAMRSEYEEEIHAVEAELELDEFNIQLTNQTLAEMANNRGTGSNDNQ